MQMQCKYALRIYMANWISPARWTSHRHEYQSSEEYFDSYIKCRAAERESAKKNESEWNEEEGKVENIFRLKKMYLIQLSLLKLRKKIGTCSGGKSKAEDVTTTICSISWETALDFSNLQFLLVRVIFFCLNLVSKGREKMSTMYGMMRKCSNFVSKIRNVKKTRRSSFLCSHDEFSNMRYFFAFRSAQAKQKNGSKKLKESYILVCTIKYSIHTDRRHRNRQNKQNCLCEKWHATNWGSQAYTEQLNRK